MENVYDSRTFMHNSAIQKNASSQSFLPRTLFCLILIFTLFSSYLLPVFATVDLATLYDFSAKSATRSMSGLVQSRDGNFYGASSQGGIYGLGTIFRISPKKVLTVLYSFSEGVSQENDCQAGAYPNQIMQASDGNLYGTTYSGGKKGAGSVFKITTKGLFTELYSFETTLPSGSHPSGRLIQASDGNLYGTTYTGGTSNAGTTFKISLNGTLTTIYSFAYATGSLPCAGLVQASDGALYGTTSSGGETNYGILYKISLDGTFTSLHSFSSDAYGNYTELTQASDGFLYGVTSIGGPSFSGTIYRVAADGTFTNFYTFGGLNDGYYPIGALVQASDGNLYGATQYGPSREEISSTGTVFKISTDGTFATVHAFSDTGSEGANPHTNLIQASDGSLYGTTQYGGTGAYGTVFRIAEDGSESTFYTFGFVHGYSPKGKLIQGDDGNFYGTTYLGGRAGNFGTVFKLSEHGVLTQLYSFTLDSTTGLYPNGRYPNGGLVQTSKGIFYGTTSMGGTSDCGTVYRITNKGLLTTVHSFAGTEGCNPIGSLIQASDGNLYGVTSSGTVFKISTSGTLTTLHSFVDESEGLNPSAGLVQANDGNLYGVTQFGGVDSNGTIFKISTNGTFSSIHAFDPSGGVDPVASLVQAADGKLYGTTMFGVAGGVIYSITSEGTYTVVHSLDGNTDGASPQASLLQASDGNLYSTAERGGANGGGTVFRISPSGVFTVVYAFDAYSGPNAPAVGSDLVQTRSGILYGVTSEGPLNNSAGVIYQLSAGLPRKLPSNHEKSVVLNRNGKEDQMALHKSVMSKQE